MNVNSRQMAREAYRRLVYEPPKKTTPDVVASLRERIRADLFPQQLAFMDDPAKSKAALCTRRAGKTTETAADLLDGALDTPSAESLYLTITRERAKDLLWAELKSLSNKHQIGLKFNEVELTATIPEALGGGRVKLAGADKAKEIEKRRGSKYRRVRIDEAQVFGDYLASLISDVLEPALLDYRGDLGLLGTPGVVCSGIFHDITTGKTPGWSVHRWSVLDNPFLPHAREWLEAKRLERGWTEEDPTYLREWKGQWVNDTGALFYRYSPERNSFEVVPPELELEHVIGVDLGYDDAFAMHVWAFSAHSPILYGVSSYSKSGLTPSTWFEMMLEANSRYAPRCFVVDTGGLGKAIVQDGLERYPELPLRAAAKTDKAGAVAMLNSDLVAGLVKVQDGGPLASEWKRLPKDADEPLKEDPRFPNHVSDAALYAHREARHWLGAVPQAKPKPGTQAFADAEEARWKESALRQMRKQSQPYGEDDDDFSPSTEDFDAF